MTTQKLDVGASIQTILTVGSGIVLLVATIVGDLSPRPITTGIVVFGVLVIGYLFLRLPVLLGGDQNTSEPKTRLYKLFRRLEPVFMLCLIFAFGWRAFTGARGAAQEWDPRRCPENSNKPTVLISQFQGDKDGTIGGRIYDELANTLGKISGISVEFCIYTQPLRDEIDVEQVLKDYNPLMVVRGRVISENQFQIFVSLKDPVDLGDDMVFDLDRQDTPPVVDSVESATLQIKLRVGCYLAQSMGFIEADVEDYEAQRKLSYDISRLILPDVPVEKYPEADKLRIGRCQFNAAQLIAQNWETFPEPSVSRDRAIALFSAAIENDPHLFDAYLNQATLKLERGDEWSEVEQDYLELFELINKPSTGYSKASDAAFGAYTTVIAYYAASGEPEKIQALSASLLKPYKKLRASEYQNPLHYHYVAYIQLILGEFGEAVDSYEESKSYFTRDAYSPYVMFGDLNALKEAYPEMSSDISLILYTLTTPR
jgi:hypothetical protein